MLQWDHCAQTVQTGYEHTLQVLTDEAAASANELKLVAGEAG